MKFVKSYLPIAIAAALAACGGGGDGDTTSVGSPTSSNTILTGVLVDAPVAGIGYRTESRNGVTDGDGKFQYLPGETVTFYIGQVALPPAPAAPVMTPLTLAGSDDINDQKVANMLVLLQSLDQDGNPSNGIVIPARAAQAATAVISFDTAPQTFASNDTVKALVANSGSSNVNSVSVAAAQAHFITTINTQNINVKPQANAGQLQSVQTGTTVTLDGSTSTDVNGDALTYAWTINSKPNGSSAVLSNAAVAKPTFTADAAGNYAFNLVVSDGKLSSTVSTVTVSAAVANVAPVAKAGTAQNVTTGSAITLDGSGSSDANGDTLTYAWTITSKPAGSAATLSNATSVKPTLTTDKAGDYVFSLVASDGKLTSTVSTVTVSAAVANVAPIAKAGTAQNVTTGSTITLDGSGSSDANGDTLTYAWSITSKPNGSSATLSSLSAVKPTFTADKAGDYILSLVVSDGKLASTVSTVTVSAAVANVAPIAKAGTDQNVTTGSTITLDGSGSSDANGDTLTYTWTIRSKPSGSTATLSGTTSVKPTFTADKAGDYVISLVVSDGKLSSPASAVTLTAVTLNVAPIANAGQNQRVVAGSSVNLDGSNSYDANGDSLTYAWSLTSRPPGSQASIKEANSINPVLNTDIPGTYVASLAVGDGKLTSPSATTTILAVPEISGALSITSSSSYNDFCGISGSLTEFSSYGGSAWTFINCHVYGQAGSVLWARIQNNNKYQITTTSIYIFAEPFGKTFNINTSSQTIPPNSYVDFALPLWTGTDVTNAVAEFTITGKPKLTIKMSGNLYLP
jgi:hypothetical protein